MRSILCATAGLVALLSTTDTASAGTATGCLKKNGQLVHLALGEAPKKRCPRGATRISLGVHQPGGVVPFHEVLAFGETMQITVGKGEFLIDGDCNEQSPHRWARLVVHNPHPGVTIANNGDGGIVIVSAVQGNLRAEYEMPHPHNLAAEARTLELLNEDGTRVRVEAVVLVNGNECVFSGTAELFGGAGGS